MKENTNNPISNKHYNNSDRISNEINTIIQTTNKLPNIASLKKHNPYLYDSILNSPGGLNKFYDDFIINRLNQIINKIKKFPTLLDLSKLEEGNLIYLINLNGGLTKFKLMMGYNLLQVPDGYYKDIDNIKKIIDDYISIYNEEPTIIQLEKFKPGIKFAISKYHGGYRELKEKLNLKEIIKPDYYWKDFENVKVAIEDIESDIGMFPSYSDIVKSKYSGLMGGISKYHNGLNEVRKRLKIPVTTISKLEHRIKILLTRYIDSENYVDNWRKRLYDKFNLELISPISGSWMELDRYYPDFKVAFEVSGEQHSKANKYFSQGKGLTPDQYLDVIKFLDKSKLFQCNRQGVTIIYVDKDMSDDEIINKAKQYLPIRDKFIDIPDLVLDYDNADIKSILYDIQKTKEDGIITSDDIKKYSQPLYKSLIKTYGNINNLRSSFGLSNPRLYRDYWSLDITLTKLEEVINSIGHFPKKSDIMNIDPKLYYAITKHGGLRKLKCYYT